MTPERTSAELFPSALRCERHVLDNGLVVLLHPDESRADISMSVCYRVGAKDDDEGGSGMAHLVEHLMFGGSPALRGPFTEAMKEAGVSGVNAYTTHDRTCYYQTVPPEALPFAIFAEADRMGNFRTHLTEAAVAAERTIVIEERAQTGTDVPSLSQQLVREGLYPFGHPYRRPVIGLTPDLLAATVETIRAWHERFYSPDNAVLVLAGALDAAETLALVESHFAPLAPSRPWRTVVEWQPDLRGRRHTQLRCPSPDGDLVYRVWPAPATGRPSAVLLHLLAGYLGNGDLSPLQRGLVAEQLATDVLATFQRGEVCGQFFVVARPGRGVDHETLAKGMTACIREALDGTGDQLQFERVRRLHGNELQRLMSNLEDRVQLFLDGEMEARDPHLVQSEWDIAQTLDLRDLLAEGRRWLCDESFTLFLKDEEAPKRALKPGPRPPRPHVSVAPTALPDRSLHVEALANGVRLARLACDGAGDFALRLEMPRGHACEPPDRAGITGLVASLPLHGTGPFDAARLREIGEDEGLSIEVGSLATEVWIEITGPATATAPSLAVEILRALVLEPRFDAEMLEDIKFKQSKELAFDGKDPVASALRDQRARIYGADSPEVSDGRGTADSLAAIDVRALRAWHDQLFDPAGALLLACAPGPSLAEIVEGLGGLERDWTTRPTRAMPTPPAPPRRGHEHVRLHRSGPSDQAVLAMALPLPVSDEPRDREAVAAACVLLHARLSRRLREDQNWTYEVEADIAWPQFRELPPLLTITSAVNARQAGSAIAQMAAVYRDLIVGQPPTVKDIAEYRLALRRGLAQVGRSSRELLPFASRAVHRGIRHPLQARIDATADLLPSDVVAVLNEAISAAPVAWTVVGSAPGILDALAASGLRVVVDGDEERADPLAEAAHR